MIEEDKKELQKVLQEISNSKTRMEGEREYIKEAISLASEKYQIDKRTLRKVAKAFHLQNITKEIEEMHEFMEKYETITGTKLD
jgi:hypothetical protein